MTDAHADAPTPLEQLIDELAHGRRKKPDPVNAPDPTAVRYVKTEHPRTGEPIYTAVDPADAPTRTGREQLRERFEQLLREELRDDQFTEWCIQATSKTLGVVLAEIEQADSPSPVVPTGKGEQHCQQCGRMSYVGDPIDVQHHADCRDNPEPNAEAGEAIEAYEDELERLQGIIATQQASLTQLRDQVAKVKALVGPRIRGLAHNGSDVCAEFVPHHGEITASCDRCAYPPEIHMLRDVLEIAEKESKVDG